MPLRMLCTGTIIQPSHHLELMQEIKAVGSHHAAMAELKQVRLYHDHDIGIRWLCLVRMTLRQEYTRSKYQPTDSCDGVLHYAACMCCTG